MKYFARALREAWHLWLPLVASVFCSLGVAALWGLNIAALFPIIQTTLNGQSLQDWNRERLTGATQAIAANQATIDDLDHRLPLIAEAAEQKRLKLEVEILQTRMHADRATVYSAERMQGFFDRYLPVTPFATVVMIVSLVAAGTLAKQVLSVTNTMLVNFVSQSIARDVRTRIFNQALSLDRPGFNRHGISGFAALIAHTTDMLATGITSFYGGAVTEPMRIMACLCGAWVISWRLTLASLIFAPLAAYIMLHLNRRIRALAVRIFDRSLGFHHIMLEVFHSLLTVHAYTMEDFEKQRFGKATENIKRTALTSTFYNSLTSPLTEFFGMGMLCIGLTVSSYLVLNQETAIFGIPMTDKPISVAAVTVFFGMLIGAADPLRKLSSVITGVNTGMAAANILYPLLEVESRLVESPSPKPYPAPHRRIEFRDITFSYDGAHPVLQGVNLTVSAGERLAVVGPNGGGKSTLINLLCRFYDPQHGDVLIDGVALREMAIKDLRQRIALVTQQTELFNETIMHNIRYGRWTASDAEVVAAAELARAHDFISGFPEGYQTLVGPNGQRLSGGQRQRIALARAFLRNAEILILDEATSQIDVESEQLIHEALSDYGRSRTLIMVTHRESTLSLATRIVRIDNGALEQLAPSDAKAA